MAVSAVMAAVSTGAAALAGGAFMSIAAVGLTGAFGHFLISTAMGAALNALTPKPNMGGTRGYSISGESGAALDHQIIYGRTRVGGVRVYDASTGTNNNFLHRIMAFAGHEIESYDEIYLNDEVVTLDGSGNVTSPTRYNGFVRIHRYYGTDGQAADTDLISETASLSPTAGKWTTSHRLQGIAYLYIRFKYNQDAFPNGIPAVSATIKGKKVYNPDTTVTEWTDTPALCLRDYLISPYGLDQPESRIDDASIIAAANICDGLVSGIKRYTCNGSFVTSYAPNQVISDILTSMGGLFWYSQGKWRMKAAAYTTPTVTLDENDLRSGISLSTRHSRRNNFNKVKGTFRGAESDWQVADYPAVTDPLFLAADNNIESIVDVPLPFTSDSITSQRLANIFLRRNREQLTFSASFGLKAFQVEVGDFVYINNTRFGWSNKPFEVTSWTFGLTEGLDLQVQMTLREISSAVFTLQDASIFENNNTNLPSAFAAVPVGLGVTGEVRVINESLTDVIIADVSATEPSNVERVEVQFKKAADANWTIIGVGDLGKYEALAIDPSSKYDIRARSYSFLGVKSDWIYFNGFSPVGLASPPANVANFHANLNGGVITLEWDAVPDLDLSYYLVRHALEETGATFSNSTTAIEKVSRPGTSASVPTRPGTYAIRAYDKLGNPSVDTTQVVVPVAALETFTNNPTDVESPTFPGTKTNCSVTSNELRINNVALTTTGASGTGSTATLTFATQASAPFGIGSSIVVFGVTPEAYNGTFVVTACTTTSVSYASTATGSQTVAGKVAPNVQSATYTFTGNIDTGAVRRVRSRVDVNVSRYDSVSGGFDALPGLFDSLAGLFDDLTSNTQVADTDVLTYISITQDNPAGSPTWSPYQLFKAGDFYGRAFRFQVVLNSSSAGISPSISGLTARVQYN
jgi:hypothetical protein